MKINNRFATMAAGMAVLCLVACQDVPTGLDNEDTVKEGPDIVVTETVDAFTVVPEELWSDPIDLSFSESEQDLPTPVAMGRDQVDATTFPDEAPGHYIALSSKIRVMKVEVTAEQFKMFAEAYSDQVAEPEEPFWGWENFRGESRMDYPITKVTWKEADAFARWIGGRLPTETEWEMMAKTKLTRDVVTGAITRMESIKYSSGTDCKKCAWYYNNSVDTVKMVMRDDEEFFMTGYMPHPGGMTKTGTTDSPYNYFGLADMSGNVMEWCSDWYGADYYKKCFDAVTGRTFTVNGATPEDDVTYNVVTDPKGPATGKLKVLRGGSWYRPEYACSVFNRQKIHPGTRSEEIGFRVVMDVE